MKDVPEYVRLQKKRIELKRKLAEIFGQDLSRLLSNYDRVINRIVDEAGSVLTSDEFNDIIKSFAEELNFTAKQNQDFGRGSVIELNKSIQEALEFRYPIDYQLLPKVTIDPFQIKREFLSLLNNYRKGNISETVLKRSLRGRLHRPAYQVDSAVITQLAGFDNTSQKTIADLAGLNKAIYHGPLSPNTRLWCEKMLLMHKLWTESEISLLDNGQGIPVIRYCGGYRCVHEWLWVDPEWSEIKNLV